MKIHIISNSPRMNSGFSIVAKNIANGLKNLGHDITYTGMQTVYSPEYGHGMEVLPIQVGHIDDMTQYMITLDRIKPDVVLAIFQMDYEFNDFAKVFPKTVIYSPVEGRNINQKMANDLLQVKMNGGEVVAQTKYGQGEIQLALAGIDIPYIYHGFDDKIFKILNLQNMNEMRYCYYKTEYGKANSDPIMLHKSGCYDCQLSKSEENKCPHYKEEQVAILKFINGKWTEESIPITHLPIITKGKFVFLFVGQNLGIRKRIERLLKAYYLFIKDSTQLKDRTFLHLHTMPISIGGVNLIKTIQDLGIQENIIFSYGTYRSSGWSNEAINVLYNTADVNISASSSEGFCILPDSPIFTLDRGVQKIKDTKVGDKVLTHKGRFRKVSQIMKREYNGDMIKITSHKMGIPIVLTPEHRVLGIRTVPCNKSGSITKGKDICKPGQCYYMKNGIQYKWCKYINGEEPYRRYKTEWICAGSLEIGDFLTYPRANENVIDIAEIIIRDYIDDFLNVIGGEYSDSSKQSDLFGSFVEDTICMNANYSRKYAKIPAKIELDGDLMKLFGYFIAEGDIAGERQIEFSFNINELEYVEDVERIMKEKFGLDTEHIIDKKINNEKINVHILRYSNKVLSNMFQNMFCPKEYIKRKGKGSKSNIVRIPPEFLNLPLEKLAKLIKAEWRGDGTEFASSGGTYQITTTSETLAHQLLHILSRFGILASFRVADWNSKQNENWSLQYNIEIHGKDIEIFSSIIGQKNEYRDIKVDRDSKYLKGKNLYYTPIKDIEIIKYNGDVWNLEVEEDNSYVSSVVLHNCLPVLEGFATGIPMLAPDCSSFTELIGNGDKDPENRGLLANIGEWQMIENGSERALVNEQHLSTMMKKMYQNEDLRKTFSKNAIKFAQNYTWEKIVKKWDQLLKNM